MQDVRDSDNSVKEIRNNCVTQITESQSQGYCYGAGGIARYLGPPWNSRKVYKAAEKKTLPIGRIGKLLIASKAALDRRLTDITSGE
jgi:hypothetical protein